MDKELAKLEELHGMGFITDEEWQKRREILTGSSSTATTSSVAVTATTPRITTIEEAIGQHGFNFAIVSGVTELHLESLLRTFKPPRCTVLHGPQIGPRESLEAMFEVLGSTMPSQVAGAISAHGGRVALVFTPANAIDVAPLLESGPCALAKSKPTLVAGSNSEYQIAIIAGPTNLAPDRTSLFQAMNIPTKISKGQIEVIHDADLLGVDQAITEDFVKLYSILPVELLEISSPLIVAERVSAGEIVEPGKVADGDRALNLAAHAVDSIAAVGFATEFVTEPQVMMITRLAALNVVALKSEVEEMEKLAAEQARIAAKRAQIMKEFEAQKAELEAAERSLVEEVRQVQAKHVEEARKLDAEIEEFEKDIFPRLKEKYKRENFGEPGVHFSCSASPLAVVPGTTQTVSCLIEVRVGMSVGEPLSRPPFNLVVVLDRSGSMSGSSIENSKQAILALLDKLIPSDMVSLVTYDSSATIEFQNGTIKQKQELIRIVRGIGAGSTTNISDGLRLAYKILAESTSSAHRRVFLFSDGQANGGITGVPQMCELVKSHRESEDIITTAFGIGADFNSAMMQGIAAAGGGQYNFIDKAESIPELLDKGVRGISSLLGGHGRLRIETEKGVVLCTAPADFSNLGDIRFSDLKQILVEINVTPPSLLVPGAQPFVALRCSLDYTLVEGLTDEAKIAAAIPDPVTLQLETRSSSDTLPVDPKVEVLKAIRGAATLDKQVLQAVDRRDWVRAAQLKRSIIRELEAVVGSDPYGFTQVLLHRAKKALADYTDQELQAQISNMQQQIRDRVAQFNFRLREVDAEAETLKFHEAPVAAAGSRRSKKSEAMVKKEAECRALEEEDADIGFGLFD